MEPTEEEVDLAYEMAADVHAVEQARWSEDQLAYDGWSAWPMRRELTPLERDVLTRILDGWWHRLIELDAARRGERPSFLNAAVAVDGGMLDDPSLAWMRMSTTEVQMLLDLRRVLTPRQD